MPDNTVTIIGNVTRDPELRFLASGNANATFGVAVNRRWQNKQTNEWAGIRTTGQSYVWSPHL